MKGGRTVSSGGKSIAHILHHLIGAKIAGRVIRWMASVLSKASETESRPRSPIERGRKRLDQIIQQTRFTAEDQLMHGIGRIEGRFTSISCVLEKARRVGRSRKIDQRLVTWPTPEANGASGFSSAPSSAV